MQSNLVGKYIKRGHGNNIVYNEIVAVYVYKGNLYLIASNSNNTLYRCEGLNPTVVVERNSIPAEELK